MSNTVLHMYKQQLHRTISSKVSWLDVMKSTLMSFLGIQKEETRKRDFEHGNPVHFIIMGIAMTVTLVLVLIIIIKVILHFSGVQ